MIYPLDSNLHPVIDGRAYDAIMLDEAWQEAEVMRSASEPWYWIVNYCWTRWSSDDGLESFVDRVPAKSYLQVIADDWYRHRNYAISKSRQMMVTWLMVILHCHECFFKDYIQAYCQSKKEDDADVEMIQRARFVCLNLPGWMQVYSPVKYSFCKLVFTKTSSLMKGIPSGGDQIRSHNPNYLLSDEIAFQNEAEQSYTAALACCKKITLVTSANPGWASDFYNDRLSI